MSAMPSITLHSSAPDLLLPSLPAQHHLHFRARGLSPLRSSGLDVPRRSRLSQSPKRARSTSWPFNQSRGPLTAVGQATMRPPSSPARRPACCRAAPSFRPQLPLICQAEASPGLHSVRLTRSSPVIDPPLSPAAMVDSPTTAVSPVSLAWQGCSAVRQDRLPNPSTRSSFKMRPP
ncbi:hypothetical protein NDU88_002528 [Pleurodeles waltl]|uniref:Uncharacterized protein n=1 Tax=Pleurodeles waltl TaxID=8319 RepID=A0AAV7M2Q9_PLEWA|nr:hypothetical protein NDU88_002528 [Pleurodeles waltl]